MENRTKTPQEIAFFEEYGVWPITDANIPEQDKVYLTPEQLAETERAVLRINAKSYLTETDWYVTRKTETGKDIPEEVLKKREQARFDASS